MRHPNNKENFRENFLNKYKNKSGKNKFQKQSRPKSQSVQTLKATVSKNRKGFAFLCFQNKSLKDLYVPPRQASQLFEGDRVQVTFASQNGEIHDIKLIEHRFRELVGRFTPNHESSKNRKSHGWVVYEKRKTHIEVYLPEVPPKTKSGDWIRVKLEFNSRHGDSTTGKVLDNYGQDLPASADIIMVSAEYGLSEGHSQQAITEARNYKLDVEARKNLSHIPFVTIDGETARDFDDAVYVEKKNGGYKLWVAIADVSNYVKTGTALDAEARQRGTSVYFPERAFHMLPSELSENLCSLKPKEPRLAFVAEISVDQSGKKLETHLIEAVIESRRRATYNEIQNEYEANKNNPKWEFTPHFELYEILRSYRNKRGSLDFDLSEAEIKADPLGNPISITKRERLDSHRLIEVFMIAANEAVTEWMLKRKQPFLYRIHEDPSEEALVKFQKLAATVGMSFAVTQKNLHQSLLKFVKTIENHPAKELLNTTLLRSMKQAVYSANHGGHFGLASDAYTHFTSPIRRYPDLVVHRLLKQALHSQKNSSSKLNQELPEIAEHCSYRERLAAEAERDSIKLKQIRLMLKHLGDEFEGKIIGMIETGLFVQLDDPFVEGMISKDSLKDDVYEFDENRMIFYGKKKKRTFKMGDSVKIQVVRVDLEYRYIDFGLVT